MRRERAAGGGVLGVIGILLVLQVVWIARHCDALRPFAPGDVAPPIRVRAADGRGELELASLRGKVVLIDFWATWCGPCAQTMPMLSRLHQEHRAAGLEVLSINTDGGPRAPGLAQAYANRNKLPFRVWVDDGTAADAYKVETIPHMVLVDRKGVVRDVHVGVSPLGTGRMERDLDDHIAKLLAETP